MLLGQVVLECDDDLTANLNLDRGDLEIDPSRKRCLRPENHLDEFGASKNDDLPNLHEGGIKM